MVSTIFSDAANVKHFTIDFIKEDKTRIEFINEHIITFEAQFERDNPKVNALLQIKDIIDLNRTIDWRKTKIAVYILDKLDVLSFRQYRIVSMDENQNDMKEYYYTIKLQDEVSYILQNTFVSKSFSGVSRCNALKSYLLEYGLLDVLSEYNETFECTDDGDTSNFVISAGESVLSQFQKEFKRLGYSFYQDRGGLKAKPQSEVLPASLLEKGKEITEKFSQEVKNQCYANKIHEIKNKPLDKENVNATPEAKSHYFDPDNKKMIVTSNNSSNLTNSGTNSDIQNVKDTVGSNAEFKTKSSDDGYNAKVTDSYLKKAQTVIYVRGYFERDINTIINMELPGSKGISESSIEGNAQNAGKYLITRVTDKVFTGKLIQRINLARSDQN